MPPSREGTPVATRRYEVRGTEQEGDVWSFHTDNADRAQEMMAQMREDLRDVELIDHEAAKVQESTFS